MRVAFRECVQVPPGGEAGRTPDATRTRRYRYPRWNDTSTRIELGSKLTLQGTHQVAQKSKTAGSSLAIYGKDTVDRTSSIGSYMQRHTISLNSESEVIAVTVMLLDVTGRLVLWGGQTLSLYP
jgi:hypothetical protein